MAVVLVPEGERPDDEAVPEADYRHLVAELVLPVLLALAYAEHVGLVERVYLVAVNLLAVDGLQAQPEAGAVRAVRRQLAEQLPDEPPRYGAHPAVGFGHLVLAVRPAPETLRELQPLHFAHIALAHLAPCLTGRLAAQFDDLVRQLRVGRGRHVLLLHGRVHERRLPLAAPPVLSLPLPALHGEVDADALLEYEPDAAVAYAVAEADQLRRRARRRRDERLHPAEVLVVCVLRELRHDLLVGHVADVPELGQTPVIRRTGLGGRCPHSTAGRRLSRSPSSRPCSTA